MVHSGGSGIRRRTPDSSDIFFSAACSSGSPSRPSHRPANAGRGLALVGIIFGSVVLHELGHALVGAARRGSAKAIILLPIGGVTLLDETQQSRRAGRPHMETRHSHRAGRATGQFAIAFAAAGILLAVAPEIHIMGQACTCIPAIWLAAWSGSNLWLASIQPAAGLSHGRRQGAARVVQPPHGSRSRHATRSTIGQAFATLFMLLGMMWNIWLTMIGFFLFIAAQLGGTLRGISVGAGNGASGRHHADRLRHALSRPTRWRMRWTRPCIPCRMISP